MVLGKLPVPGRHTNFEKCKARAYCAYIFIPRPKGSGDIALVGCFGFNGLLRQYFSLYRAVSQGEGERHQKG